MLKEVLVSVESAANRISQGHGETNRLAEDVKTATSQQLVVPLDTRPEEFSKILTRPSLRAEAIGLVLSMAGNAAICLLESDIVFSVSDMHVLDRKAFAKDMLFSQRRSHYHC